MEHVLIIIGIQGPTLLESTSTCDVHWARKRDPVFSKWGIGKRYYEKTHSSLNCHRNEHELTVTSLDQPGPSRMVKNCPS